MKKVKKLINSGGHINKMNKITILGAGIAGLSAGYFLKQKNQEIIIYEKIILMVDYVITLLLMGFDLINLYIYVLLKILK